MKTLNALIVDDEQDCLEALQSLIGTHCPDVHVVATAQNLADAHLALEKHEPDVLFLDIRLNHEEGFDLLNQGISEDVVVIVVSAHEEYALEAIKTKATDYLLKPVNYLELKSSIKEVKATIEKRRQSGMHKQEKDKLGIPTKNGFEFIKLNGIIHLESDNSYTTLFLANGERHMVSRSIKSFEEYLPNETFFRVHQSHLVHLQHIKAYSKQDGGTIIMTNGKAVPISKRKKSELMKILDTYRI